MKSATINKTVTRGEPQQPILISSRMKLEELLSGIELLHLSGPSDTKITSLAYSSSQVRPGALFFALRGEKTDGNRFVADAIERGAIAIASEQPAPAALPPELRGHRRRIRAGYSPARPPISSDVPPIPYNWWA